MYRVFNCGVGMVLVVSSDESIDVIKHLEAQGEKAWLIGEIVKNDGV
jgi:phosphoribosylformylglycinamidine cyclo-ligase